MCLITNKPSRIHVKIIFNVADVIFNLEVLKGKLTKSIWIMAHLKLYKKMFLEQKIWKKNKNCNSYGLTTIWSNLNHSKVPNY